MRLALLILVLLIGRSGFAKEKLPSLCKATETEIFNCQLKGKTLSLCGAGDLSKQPGTMQYRFGTSQKIELEYPDAPAPPSGHFWSSTAMYSGGGEARIHFQHAAFDYILFESTIRTAFGADGRHDPEFDAGLIIKAQGKIISLRRCSNDASILQSSIEAIPAEEFDYDLNADIHR